MALETISNQKKKVIYSITESFTIKLVVRSKEYKSKTNRHKYNDTKQVGELKLSGLHLM